MSIFDNVKTEGLEEEKDVIRGYRPLDSDVYEGTIKSAWIDEREAGSKAVVLSVDIEGKEYRESLWFVSKKGVNYFEINDKKVPLKGYTIADDICFVTTEKGLTEQKIENKILEVYDPEKKETTKQSKPTLVQLTGKHVYLAIDKNLESKNVLEGKVWVPTSETIYQNAIDKVMHHPSKKTVNEAKAGKNAAFMQKWIDANAGKVKDRRDSKFKNTKPDTGNKPARASLFS